MHSKEERECNEEVCDYDEAFEIFEDKEKTDQFMNSRLHQCENKAPCFEDGTKGLTNCSTTIAFHSVKFFYIKIF